MPCGTETLACHFGTQPAATPRANRPATSMTPISAAGNSPSRRAKASTDASLPGAHSCCQTLSGISASGSNLLANREYSCATPLAQAAVAFRELRQPGDLRLPDFGRTTAADTDPVHQAVPPERERAEAPTGFDRLVDGTAVLARQPRPAGRPAGRRPEADDAQVVFPRDIAALPLLRRVFIPARLPPHAASVKRRLCVAADRATLRTGCARTVR